MSDCAGTLRTNPPGQTLACTLPQPHSACQTHCDDRCALLLLQAAQQLQQQQVSRRGIMSHVPVPYLHS